MWQRCGQLVTISCSEAAGVCQVYDGFDESAPELMRACGTQIPAPIMSTGNGIFIKFDAISLEAQEGSKFKLSWRKIDESSPIRHGSFKKWIQKILVLLFYILRFQSNNLKK